MSKKRILAWCDFVAPTGFGNVAKNLLDDLYKDYELSIIGINYYGNIKYDTSKYFIYTVSREDMLGIQRLYEVAQRDQPDLIFLFQDIFHIAEIIKNLKDKCPNSKIVIYFPVDGAPFSLAWRPALDLADGVITYTEWAKQVILERFPDVTKDIHILYHGVDPKMFYPLSSKEIIELREDNGWTDKFVVVNVNRFQPRKAIPLSLRAFSMFAKGYKVCKCGNHFPLFNKACDLNMCPESDVIEIHDEYKHDVHYYMHMMPQEYSIGPGRTNTLQHFAINTGFTDEDYTKILSINNKNIYGGAVPESEVNKIYNAANLNIVTPTGEGKLLEGTMVLTSEGYKPIEEITEEDNVLNSNGNFSKVNKTLATKFTKTMYAIKLSKFSDPIIASDDHPFLLKSGEYKKAEDLELSDIVTLKRFKVESNNKNIDLAEYITSDKFEILEDFIRSKQTSDKKRFARFINITPELCRFFGLYIAEGSCSDNSLNFSLHQDELDLYEFIVNGFQNIFNTFGDYKKPEFKQSKKDKSGTVSMAGTILKNLLHSWFGTNAHNKKFPLWFLGLSVECRESLLQGLIDGDGSISEKRHYIRLRTCSPYLAYLTRDLYLSLNKMSSVSKEDNSLGFGNGYIYSVTCWEDRNGDISKGHFSKKYEMTNDFIYLSILEIKKIQPHGIGYDLEVPDGESYTLGQCTVHNCGLSLLEAAACGVPSIAPRNSAIPEQLRGTGRLIGNNATYYHPMDNAHCRPHVDPWLLCLGLEEEYNIWKASGVDKNINQACVDNIKKNFQWGDKRDLLKKVFREVLN